MKTPERIVKDGIAAYLKKRSLNGDPIYGEAREAGGYTYKKGLPDVWVVYKGIHFEVEIKAPGGTRSPMQIRWEQVFNKLGIRYCCVSSVSELDTILKGVD